MKKIKEFIQKFSKTEYDCRIGKWNIDISDTNVIKLDNNLKLFFHSDVQYSSNARTGFEFEDECDLILARKKIEKFTSRTLFQIKHYKNPDFGDTLKRMVTTEDIYVCYMSYDEKSDSPLDFNKKYYIVQTNEGLKIIYDMTYYADEEGWTHPVEMNTVKVLNEGELMAIEKYQAPEEAISLADYNKD